MWDVQTFNIESNAIDTSQYHIVIKSTGYLNQWKLPDVPGKESFRGALFHSAAWPKNIDLSGKNVLLIGNGLESLRLRSCR